MNLGWQGEKSDGNTGREEYIIKEGILCVVCLRVKGIRGCLKAVWKVWVENKRLNIQNRG